MKRKNDYAKQYSKINNWQYIRGKKLLELIEHKKNETILDIGCGTGELAYELARQALPFDGKLISIDPDSERLKRANNNQPKSINNITYFNDNAEKLTNIKESSIDIIYSNYVIHWVKNKENMLSEFYRCLQQNGYCILEFIESLPQFEKEITLLTGIFAKDLINKFYCINKKDWITLLRLFGFKVDYVNLPILEYNFDSIEHFLDWWEGTTNGMFSRLNIPIASMKLLRETYPDKINFQGTSIQLIISKSEKTT
jgi:ubiquinone/menaquinone biosynthesis C-methylase UbiE